MGEYNEFEIEGRWRISGLLDGHEGYEALTLSNNLQEAADYLSREVDSEGRSFYAGLFLPIVVRLFNERNVTSFDIESLYEYFIKYAKNHRELLRKDEAEFCCKFVEDAETSEFVF